MAASTEKCILDKKAGSKNSGKSAGIKRPAQPPIKCPECSSLRIWKDGLRYTNHGPVQRYICRNCAYRFSDPNFQHNLNGSDMPQHVQNVVTKKIKTYADILNHRQVCAALTRGTKNLTEVETRHEIAQREGAKPDAKVMRGLIVQYMAWLEKEGYKTGAYLTLIRLLAIRGANLLDPEDVKKVLAKQPWKDSVKLVAVSAYKVFAKMQGITWTPPKYKPEDTLPFVPEESELDQLIASCKSRRMMTFLQTLKETSADPTEALRIEWIDKDDKNMIITIRHPVKRHNARQRKVSAKLIAMLNALPKKSEQIFATNYRCMESCFLQVRKRAARTLQNPRLLKIAFKTFRHWGGSMIAHYTHGNVLAVKRALGHKRVENTMKYIHMIHFKDDEFDVATATTVEEVKKLASAGFEKVDEIQEFHVFRKPKRYGT